MRSDPFNRRLTIHPSQATCRAWISHETSPRRSASAALTPGDTPEVVYRFYPVAPEGVYRFSPVAPEKVYLPLEVWVSVFERYGTKGVKPVM